MNNIFAQFTKPNNGSDFDKELCNVYLMLNALYSIENIDMGQSHTNIHLDINDNIYNSVNFDFFEDIDGKLIEIDIYNDKRFNPYI